jgi:two-component system, NarL family, sensor histidine kinase DegS
MDTQQEQSPWEALKIELQTELEQYRREQKEIALMLDQSQLEVTKLTQRNASITAHLQQVQTHFESLPRNDIRSSYDAALDAQQRLFVMRGQLEKLQSDHNHLARQIALLDRVVQVLESGLPKESRLRTSSETTETVERMIQAQEAERQRLSRQMHDGPAQALSNFILQTEIAMRLFDLDQEKARDELSNLKVSATGTFQKVRDFIFELRPMMLDDLGLVPTLKRYVDAFKDQTGMDIRLVVSGLERRLESYQEVMVFRAVQELLNNAVRHSQASTIKINMDMSESNVKLVVEDDGRGFDAEVLEDRNSMGLKVIRERVDMLGGYFDVESRLGHGTKVTFQIPAISVSAPV